MRKITYTYSPGGAAAALVIDAKMPLAIVVLNWNNASTTIPTVQRLSEWQTLRPRVWIVDNGSRDESVARISSECPDARLLRSDHNLGFAGGNNLAVRQALVEGETDYFLLLNNDADIDEAGAQQLLATARQYHADVVGPILRDPPPDAAVQSAGGRSIAWHVDTHLYSMPSDTKPYPVEYVPGTAILIRAETFRTIGLLDEAYFISGEIADFCQRARRRGACLLIDPKVTVYHDRERSSELRVAFYTYYFLRNRFLFVRKFHPRLCWILVPRWALFGLLSITFSRLRGNRPRARALWLGLQHGLGGQFGDRSAEALAVERDVS